MSDHRNIISGRKPLLDFLSTLDDISVVSGIQLSQSFPAKLKHEILKKVPADLIREMPKKEMDRLYPLVNHQGAVLLLKEAPGVRKTSEGNWKSFLEERDGFLVLLDRIQDVNNLGSIIRSAEALGARAVFVSGKGAAPGEVSDRVSAGASFRLPVFRISNADHLIQEARKHDYWVAASSSEEDYQRHLEDEQNIKDSSDEDFEIPKKNTGEHGHQKNLLYTNHLESLPPSEKLILIIGSEGDGVKPSLIKKSDYIITIPLRGKTNSLNAGVAAGILMDRILNRPRA